MKAMQKTIYSLMAMSLMSCQSATSRIEHKNNLLLQSHIPLGKEVISTKAIPTYYHAIRQSVQNDTATIYIEGDGFAYLSRSTPSKNPTPKTPVGLHLALQDNTSPSVYYIARPCQYISGDNFKRCTTQYWTTHRYSAHILESFHHVLDHIKLNSNISHFDLVGFSGGANIAGLLATQRHDITSIRTVAGNLDNDFFTHFHQVSPMPHSLNMSNYTNRLQSVPQVHFISQNDEFVPPNISRSYLRKLDHTECVKAITVQHTTHLTGWREQWPQLLQIQPPSCQ